MFWESHWYSDKIFSMPSFSPSITEISDPCDCDRNFPLSLEDDRLKQSSMFWLNVADNDSDCYSAILCTLRCSSFGWFWSVQRDVTSKNDFSWMVIYFLLTGLEAITFFYRMTEFLSNYRFMFDSYFLYSSFLFFLMTAYFSALDLPGKPYHGRVPFKK
jgi:hypothetical protein